MAQREGGALYQVARSPYWYADFTGPDGIRHRRCTKEKDRERAVKVLGRWLADAERGQFESVAARRLKVRDLLEAVILNLKARGKRSVERAGYAVKAIEDTTLAGCRAAAVRSSSLERYIEERRQAGAADSTIKYELAQVRRAFRLALRDRRLTSMPEVPEITVHNARQVVIDRATFERIRDALGKGRQHPEMLWDLVTIAYHLGWRLNETLPLRWDRVNWQEGTITLLSGTDASGAVHTTKNDDGRLLRFDTMPELAEALQRRRAYTEAMELATGHIIPFVFHRGGKPVRDIRTAWAQALDAAGFATVTDPRSGWQLQAFRWHDFRRSTATALRRAGVSEEVAMQVTGHRTRDVFRRYRITTSEDLAEAGRKRAALEATLHDKLTSHSPNGDSGR